jgi:VanZ family protein
MEPGDVSAAPEGRRSNPAASGAPADELGANGPLARLRAWAPPVLYAAAIFWASSQPNPFPFSVGRFLAQDKLVHALAFAGLAALLVRAFRIAGVAPRAWLVAATIAASAYGVVDEWHQSFISNRMADPKDWIADTLGALVGAAVAAVVLRRRGARARVRD